MQNKIFRFAIFFLSFLLIFQWLGRKDSSVIPTDDILISSKASFSVGQPVILKVKNQTSAPVEISAYCSDQPLKVERYENGEWISALKGIEKGDCSSDTVSIDPSVVASVDFGSQNHLIFSDLGQYRITYEVEIDGKQKAYLHEIQMVQPSLIKRVWSTLLYKPIFNTLIFFIAKIPGHQLGWAIIILTLAIKIILLAPNQKALRSQKKMQRIQPQLDALREKYKDNPQMLAQETMAIWKKNKVSPAGSCLPMLIQFPVLIALFYVVRDGLLVDNPTLLYEPLSYFSVDKVNFNFIGLLDLSQKNVIVLPLIIAGLQFFQIRMSFARVKTKAGAGPMAGMNQAMQYFMPVMIAVFTASLPAAVGLYWGTSTLFSIGQQWFVNLTKD